VDATSGDCFVSLNICGPILFTPNESHNKVLHPIGENSVRFRLWLISVRLFASVWRRDRVRTPASPLLHGAASHSPVSRRYEMAEGDDIHVFVGLLLVSTIEGAMYG